MSDTLDPVGPAPEVRSERLIVLLLAICAAPLFWLGQMMLGYGVTAYICYPGDHPQSLTANGPLLAALIVFDVVALAACVTGAWLSLAAWRRSRNLSEGRNRFLAIWGMMSSLWFFVAILFNTIASVWVTPCLV
jgi:hypothetical protein